MKEKAVVDRFEGDKAVLLVGSDKDRLVVKKSFLPKGVKEGDWLQVEVRDDRILSASIDTKETESVKKRITEKMELLKKKL